MEFEIYVRDLSLEAKTRLAEEGYPFNENDNLFPLAIIEIDDEILDDYKMRRMDNE